MYLSGNSYKQQQNILIYKHSSRKQRNLYNEKEERGNKIYKQR